MVMQFFNPNPELDRYRGALLGLAAGDALGAPVEFMRPGSFEPVTEMMGGGPHGLMPGEWTDDTSMALCLAESLIECRGFDAVDQLQRYVRWWQYGHLSSTGLCFDIGFTTRDALEGFQATGLPSGLTSPDSAGNGSIMRLAPVPMFYALNMHDAVEFAGQSSATTHAAEEAVNACRFMSAVIVRALLGSSKEDVLAPPVADDLSDGIRRVAYGSFRIFSPPQIRGSGFVVESLEAALWAFHNSDNFADGATLAVSLGEDTDTTAAVYGQIAGAYYGASRIPRDWVNALARRDMIIDFADQLYDLRPLSYPGEWGTSEPAS
ncbi:ADP-ribosylarginine hydrolase Tri1 [Geodia barretti]|uniref:ADP-ribosylarginine hydrolase Tri1 n=1 Tax=Geodia barretti TaxID=519541 RepID=A0AA35T1S4_GEOBA|nr:ADP-ribosylarginine hydrolase Tri1 [Geodia barretti]